MCHKWALYTMILGQFRTSLVGKLFRDKFLVLGLFDAQEFLPSNLYMLCWVWVMKASWNKIKACEILLNQRNYRKYYFSILENFIQLENQ